MEGADRVFGRHRRDARVEVDADTSDGVCDRLRSARVAPDRRGPTCSSTLMEASKPG